MCSGWVYVHYRQVQCKSINRYTNAYIKIICKEIFYRNFVSVTAKVDKSYWNFTEFHWSSSSSSLTECVFGIAFISLFFLLYSDCDVPGWNWRRTKRHRQFSHWKGKVLPNIWTLTTNGIDFILDERKRHLKVKLMSCGRGYHAGVWDGIEFFLSIE